MWFLVTFFRKLSLAARFAVGSRGIKDQEVITWCRLRPSVRAGVTGWRASFCEGDQTASRAWICGTSEDELISDAEESIWAEYWCH